MAVLLAFYRSGYPVRAISIRMENRNFGFADGAGAGSSDAGAGKDGPFFAKAKMSDERVLSLKETYAPSELVPLAEPLVWLDEFKSLQRGASRTSRRITSFTSANSLAFGL